MQQNVVEANRERELWLLDPCGFLVYMVPQGWCDEWSIAAGFASGLDNTEDGPEIYCYAPVLAERNSPVDTMFIPVSDLQKMEEITEGRAQELHPALRLHLQAINQEG